MENVSVNIRAFNSKGGKGFGVLHFSHLFTNLINNLPLILRASLSVKILISSFAHKMDFAHNFDIRHETCYITCHVMSCYIT